MVRREPCLILRLILNNVPAGGFVREIILVHGGNGGLGRVEIPLLEAVLKGIPLPPWSIGILGLNKKFPAKSA